MMLGCHSPTPQAPIDSAHLQDPALPDSINRVNSFTVKFWGVRGGIPTPGSTTVRYGGNTLCVELNVAGKRIIFDGGTGLRVLGKHLLQQMPVEAHLFFSHTHWDRIQGFPFFLPAFLEGNRFDIYGSQGINGASIKQRLGEQMLRPSFPVPLHEMRSELNFHSVIPGTVISLDDVAIEALTLNHSSGALGYRVNWQGRSVVYAIDAQHSPSCADQRLLRLANRAELLIYNALHVDSDYYDPRAIVSGQQPATWQAAIEVATAAQVKQVVLCHHDPGHDDDFLDQIAATIQSHCPRIQLAREGTVLQIMEQRDYCSD